MPLALKVKIKRKNCVLEAIPDYSWKMPSRNNFKNQVNAIMAYYNEH